MATGLVTGLIVVTALGAFSESSDRSTFCVSPGVDPADRDQMRLLYYAASFDRRLNMITRPLDAATIGRFEDGLRGGHPPVQTSALVILASAVEQEALPPGEPARAVAREVAAIAAGADPSPAAELVRLHARRVLWHLSVRSIADAGDRAELLAPRLSEEGPDGPYYAYEAIDYLAELGASGGAVLRAFLEEGTRRSLDPDLVERARLALRKIELSERIPEMGRASAAAALAAAVHTPTRRQMDREFRIWVVEQLARLRPEADSRLRALADDDSAAEEIRLASEFALEGPPPQIRWRW